MVGTREEPAQADDGGDCPDEGDCTFKKPNIMIIMDYSTSMNTLWDMQNNLTRWQVVVQSIKTVTQDGSFLSQNTHLALMRFGHDPSAAAGTLIPNDSSGITDGQKLDVPWYDAQNDPWYECNGAAIGAALDAAGDPINGSLVGIGTWTKGALDYTKTLIDASVAAHPEDNGERTYLNVVVTDGAWTGMDGTTPLAPANQNPAITAADLFDNDNVRTYVVAVAGDVNAEAAADQLATAGGTGPTAIDGDTPALLEQALADLVQSIIDDVVAPECVGGLPRIMVLLDASSSMLNVGGGTMAGAMGTTGWDKAREALAGDVDSLFDLELVNLPGQAVEDVVHLGLAVFGHNAPAPGEQKILVDYGPCMKDNFAWALDPNTSCEMPGCDDPWGGPPITWTFKDGTQDPPGFDRPTDSHMPQCAGNNLFCSGSGTYTHLGLQLIKNNQVAYAAAAAMNGAEFPANDQTEYINILITDGQYTGYSTNAQVQTELEQMFNDGITTYVIGFGDGVDTPAAIAQLNSMADWGSGATLDYYDANSQAALEMALSDIIASISFDPCCAFNDCSENPEPTTVEPDPVPSDEGTATDTTTTDGTTTDGTTTTDGETTTEGDTTTTEGDTTDGTTDGGTTTTDGGTDDNSTNGDEIGTDTTGTGDTGGVGEDDGCNCSVPDSDTGKTRGLAGSLLLLGLAGLVRRRRRD
ncbi:MYXO-CTERM sorting domain-containing protein [Nannocystaceae bacterium ST9]